MTFLLLAISCSSFNHLLFKALARFRIDLLSVVTVNYVVCIVIGYNSLAETAFETSIFAQPWYPFSIVQGAIFMICLLLIGRTTEKHGVAVASVSARLSVVLPTVAAFFLYSEPVTALKLTGISAALLALYLSGVSPQKSSKGSSHRLRTISMLPIVLFISFGTLSTLIKYVQESYLDSVSYHTYVMSSFAWAFIFSGLILGRQLRKNRKIFRWKELACGITLGCVNYGAIYFLVRALSVPGWQSSQLFPTISISVVVLSSFGAWVIFKERPHRQMIAAIAIGAIAIILINLS